MGFPSMNLNVFSFRPRRILYRIILPFTLLFGIATTFSWLLSAYFVTRYLDQSLKVQMEQLVGAISKSSYILNPAILHQIKEVSKAEIVLFDQNGRILRSTFSERGDEERFRTILEGYSNKAFAAKDLHFGGVRYRTIVNSIVLPEYGPAFLSLWMPTHEENRLKAGIILGIGGIAFLGIIAMAVMAYLIARTITAPVEELAMLTGKISRGDLSQRVRVHSVDEIGSLAAAFNHMIDQFKVFEEKLVESEKLATAGQMAAGFAHEIRNPLTSIKMFGQVLHNRLKEQPEDQRILVSLVKEISRLDRIIQEMIERTSPGELNKEWQDLNESVYEVIIVAEESLNAQRIAVEKTLFPDLPEVYMDREKVKGVLWNLILNAREAMPKGGRLIVSTGIVDSAFVEISVEDSGQGIVTKDVEQFFQPFFTTKPEGVGLGLTMSRKIVEKHGGDLKLENRPEGGTKARVVLPLKKV